MYVMLSNANFTYGTHTQLHHCCARVLEYDGSVCSIKTMDNKDEGSSTLYVGAIKGRHALQSLYVHVILQQAIAH